MTITIYGANCSSSRKAMKWLDKKNVQHTYRDISKQPLSKSEISHILSLTENGTEDILSVNSNIYKQLNLDFNAISFNELLSEIEKHQGLLKTPLLFNDHKLQVGFNDSIRQFIPKEEREKSLLSSLKMNLNPPIEEVLF